MIKFIAAVDNKLGIANEHGIPWQGKLPTDVAYFRNKTLGGNVMMGYGWYLEQKLPLPNRQNLVATSRPEVLREGFTKVKDARKFLGTATDDIWVGGGARLFEQTIDLADELYVTRIERDFHCTKFFPEFENSFRLVSQTKEQVESGIAFRFEVWRKIA